MLIESLILGMCLSLVLTETMGIAIAGIVIPGYLALILHNPLEVINLAGAGIITYLIVQVLSLYVITYGRRLLIICILIGFLITYLTRLLLTASPASLMTTMESLEFFIPGLIAYWIVRQGIIPTLSSTLIVSSLVRLIIIIIHEGIVIP